MFNVNRFFLNTKQKWNDIELHIKVSPWELPSNFNFYFHTKFNLNFQQCKILHYDILVFLTKLKGKTKNTDKTT
jgi:hypothetical protein